MLKEQIYHHHRLLVNIQETVPYVGVMMHWNWKSVYLALRRTKGSHTYDVAASTLDDIHAKYGIRKKIVHTTTNNGTNFVKAFSLAAGHHRDNTDNADDDTQCDEAATKAFKVYSALSECSSQCGHTVLLLVISVMLVTY